MVLIEFVVAFGLMLALHEFGHFIASKAFGIEVEEFGLGLPPRICKLFTWKETEFTLNWIPFGAFVKPKGENSIEGADSMRAAPAWKQIIILAAGPVMNLLTAAALFIFCIAKIGVADRTRVVLDRVEPDSPAAAAGMRAGDFILSMAGIEITHSDQVSEITQQHLDEPMKLTVSRNHQILDLTVTPLSDPPEGRGAMGVLITYPMIDVGFGEAVKAGFAETGGMIKAYLTGLWQMITGKIQLGLDTIVGPVGMYSYYSDAAEMDKEAAAELEQHIEELQSEGVDTDQRTAMTTDTSWMNRVTFFALISVCLGITNFFPIPGVDGGRILFLLPDLLFGKKIPLETENKINGISMTILMLLMFAIMFKDIFLMK